MRSTTLSGVSKSGKVKTLSDKSVGYDINLKYEDRKNAVLRYVISDKYSSGKGRFIVNGNPSVILPFGYKVDTFDD